MVRKTADTPGDFYPSGWLKPCPMGGVCIDPGNPNDCQANSRCFSFSSCADKRAFDALPDRFGVQIEDSPIVLFKNDTQVKFFLADLPFEQQQKAIVTKIF